MNEAATSAASCSGSLSVSVPSMSQKTAFGVIGYPVCRCWPKPGPHFPADALQVFATRTNQFSPWPARMS